MCALSTYFVEMVSISAEIVHVRIVNWKFLQHVGTDDSLSILLVLSWISNKLMLGLWCLLHFLWSCALYWQLYRYIASKLVGSCLPAKFSWSHQFLDGLFWMLHRIILQPLLFCFVVHHLLLWGLLIHLGFFSMSSGFLVGGLLLKCCFVLVGFFCFSLLMLLLAFCLFCYLRAS